MEISARLAAGNSATASAMVRGGGRSRRRWPTRRPAGSPGALGGGDGGLGGRLVGGRDGDDQVVRAGRLGLALEQAGRGHDRAVGGRAHQQRRALDAVQLLELGGDAHQLDRVAVRVASERARDSCPWSRPSAELWCLEYSAWGTLSL